MKKLLWCLACLVLSACNDPARDRYEASVDCAANDIARHMYVDQESDPAKSPIPPERKIWAILTARAERDGNALQIPVAHVRQEIFKRGRLIRHDVEAGKFGDTPASADVLYGKAHQCLRQSGGPAAEALLKAAW